MTSFPRERLWRPTLAAAIVALAAVGGLMPHAGRTAAVLTGEGAATLTVGTRPSCEADAFAAQVNDHDPVLWWAFDVAAPTDGGVDLGEHLASDSPSLRECGAPGVLALDPGAGPVTCTSPVPDRTATLGMWVAPGGTGRALLAPASDAAVDFTTDGVRLDVDGHTSDLTALPAGRPHLVVLTVSSEEVELFVDGEPTGRTAAPTAPLELCPTLEAGEGAWTVDDIVAFPTVLDPGSVRDLYDADHW